MGPTDVIIFGIRLQELNVILSDLLWCAVSGYAFWRLSRIRHRLPEAAVWLRWMFVLMTVAVFLGAFLGHGFQYVLGHEGKYPGWIISMWGVACFERAAILWAGERVSSKLGRIMSWANILELALFHFLILYYGSFSLVEVHAGYGLLVIGLPLHFLVWQQTRSEASRLILIGIGIAAMAVVVHLTRFGLGVWFNFHDISHLILALASWFYFKGALSMVDEEAAVKASAHSEWRVG